jgi:hypothetical protein
MQATELVDRVLRVSSQANPNYSHEQHLAWALGILAQTTLEKNHRDNVVMNSLCARLNHIANR